MKVSYKDAVKQLRYLLSQWKEYREQSLEREGEWARLTWNSEFNRSSIHAFLWKKGGLYWIRSRKAFLLHDPDVEFHARGAKIDAGWRPPVVCTIEYDGVTIYLDCDGLKGLLAC